MQTGKVSSIDQYSAAGPLAELLGPRYFRSNELLAGISDRVYSQVESRILPVEYAPGEVIFEENESGDCLYLIGEGSVKISKKGRGGQQETLTHLMERDFFGEMSLVDRARRSAQAAAEGRTILGRIDRETWDLLLHLAPHAVLSNFTRAVTQRLRQNNQHFIDQMMRAERLSLLGTTISSIVHDMNNPIGCILGASAIIQSKNSDQLIAKMAGIIRDSVDKMQVMTRELIDFSRGNTQLHLELIGIDELLQSLHPDLANCRPEIEVQIQAGSHGTLRIDRHRLLRVFGNLIRNAREAMTTGERHRLRFSIEQSGGHVRFEIADTGCGIPKELLPRILNRSLRMGNRTEQGSASP